MAAPLHDLTYGLGSYGQMKAAAAEQLVWNPYHLPEFTKAQAAGDLAKSGFGFAGHMPIIAIGPMGGKIVGYGAFHKPIYSGTSQALKLGAQHAANSQHNETSVVALLEEWLDTLGFPAKVEHGMVLLQPDVAEKLHESFGVDVKKLGPAAHAVTLKELKQYIGQPLKPAAHEAASVVAALSAGVFGADAPFKPEAVASLKIPEGKAGDLGGSHGGKIAKDKQGNLYAWKTNGGQLMPTRAEEAFARVAQLVFPKPALYAKAEVLQHGGETGVLLSWLPGTKLGNETSGDHQVTAQKLNQHFSRLVQHQVMDWLMANHDSHGANFHETPSGDVAALDKGQAFKAMGKDKLSATFKLNSSAPAYNEMWALFLQGKVKGDPVAAAQEVLARIRKLSPEQYSGILQPYLKAVEHVQGKNAAAKLEQAALVRLHDCVSNWETFLTDMTGKKVKFSFPEDEAPPVTAVQTKPVESPAMSVPGGKKLSEVPAGTKFQVVWGPQMPHKAPAWTKQANGKWTSDGGHPPTDSYGLGATTGVLTLPEVSGKTQAPSTSVKLIQKPGWPQTKGKVSVHSPGESVPAGVTWKKGYPGPGFHAETEYKGQKYQVQFLAKSGGFAAQVTLPDGNVVWASSPNQASDIVVVHANPQHKLDVNNFTATQMKEKKLGYSFAKLFQLAAFPFADAVSGDLADGASATKEVPELEKDGVVSKETAVAPAFDPLKELAATSKQLTAEDITGVPEQPAPHGYMMGLFSSDFSGHPVGTTFYEEGSAEPWIKTSLPNNDEGYPIWRDNSGYLLNEQALAAKMQGSNGTFTHPAVPEKTATSGTPVTDLPAGAPKELIASVVSALKPGSTIILAHGGGFNKQAGGWHSGFHLDGPAVHENNVIQAVSSYGPAKVDQAGFPEKEQHNWKGWVGSILPTVAELSAAPAGTQLKQDNGVVWTKGTGITWERSSDSATWSSEDLVDNGLPMSVMPAVPKAVSTGASPGPGFTASVPGMSLASSIVDDLDEAISGSVITLHTGAQFKKNNELKWNKKLGTGFGTSGGVSNADMANLVVLAVSAGEGKPSLQAPNGIAGTLPVLGLGALNAAPPGSTATDDAGSVYVKNAKNKWVGPGGGAFASEHLDGYHGKLSIPEYLKHGNDFPPTIPAQIGAFNALPPSTVVTSGESDWIKDAVTGNFLKIAGHGDGTPYTAAELASIAGGMPITVKEIGTEVPPTKPVSQVLTEDALSLAPVGSTVLDDYGVTYTKNPAGIWNNPLAAGDHFSSKLMANSKGLLTHAVDAHALTLEELDAMAVGAVLHTTNGGTFTKKAKKVWVSGGGSHYSTNNMVGETIKQPVHAAVAAPVAVPIFSGMELAWVGAKQSTIQELAALPDGTVVTTVGNSTEGAPEIPGKLTKQSGATWLNNKDAGQIVPSGKIAGYKVNILHQPGVPGWKGVMAPTVAALAILPIGTKLYNEQDYIKTISGTWAPYDHIKKTWDPDPLKAVEPHNLTSTKFAVETPDEMPVEASVAAQAAQHAVQASPPTPPVPPPAQPSINGAKPPTVVESLDELPGAAKAVGQSVWDTQGVQEEKFADASFNKTHTTPNHKPTGWPDWVPPPGTIIKASPAGEAAMGKPFWVSVVSSGHDGLGQPKAVIKFVAFDAEGNKKLGNGSVSAELALESALGAAGLFPKVLDVSNASLLNWVGLAGAVFPPGTKMQDVAALPPSKAEVVTTHPVDVPPEQKGLSVSAVMDFDTYVQTDECKKKYGNISTGKTQWLSCYDPFNPYEKLKQFLADHGLKAKYPPAPSKFPEKGTGFPGAYVKAPWGLHDVKFTGTATVAQAMAAPPPAPPAPTGHINVWTALEKEDLQYGSDPDDKAMILAAAPAGSQVELASGTYVKTGLGFWKTLSNSGNLGAADFSAQDLAGYGLPITPLISPLAAVGTGPLNSAQLDSLPVGVTVKLASTGTVHMKLSDGSWANPKVGGGGLNSTILAHGGGATLYSIGSGIPEAPAVSGTPPWSGYKKLTTAEVEALPTGAQVQTNAIAGVFTKLQDGMWQDSSGSTAGSFLLAGFLLSLVQGIVVQPAPGKPESKPVAIKLLAKSWSQKKILNTLATLPVGTKLSFPAGKVLTKMPGPMGPDAAVWSDGDKSYSGYSGFGVTNMVASGWGSATVTGPGQAAPAAIPKPQAPAADLEWTPPQTSMLNTGTPAQKLNMMNAAPAGKKLLFHNTGLVKLESGAWGADTGGPYTWAAADLANEGSPLVTVSGKSGSASKAGVVLTLGKNEDVIESQMNAAPAGAVIDFQFGSAKAKYQKKDSGTWFNVTHLGPGKTAFSVAQHLTGADSAVLSHVPGTASTPGKPSTAQLESANPGSTFTTSYGGTTSVWTKEASGVWTSNSGTKKESSGLSEFASSFVGKLDLAEKVPEKTLEQLAAEKAKAEKQQVEAAEKLAKFTAYKTWLESNPKVADATLLKVLALVKQQGDQKPFFAHVAGPDVLLGPEANLTGMGLTVSPVETPLGPLQKVNGAALANAFPGSANITGPDGKSYPHGTTFKQTEVVIGHAEADLPSIEGFKKTKPHSSPQYAADNMAVKFQNTVDVEKTATALNALGLHPVMGPAGPLVFKGDSIVFTVPKAELSKPVTKTETVPEIPPQPPAFYPKAPPFHLGAQAQGAPAVINSGDLDMLHAVKPSEWGHHIRIGKPTVLWNSQLVVKKVVGKDGKRFTEVHGELLKFDSGKAKMQSGSVGYFITGKADQHNAETGDHHHTSGTALEQFPGQTAALPNGTSVGVITGKKALNNKFVVRIPEGEDVRASLASALTVMGANADHALADHGEADELMFKKQHIVRAYMGGNAYANKENFANEAWLDQQMKGAVDHGQLKGSAADVLASAKIEIGAGGAHHVVLDDITDKDIQKANVKFLSFGYSVKSEDAVAKHVLHAIQNGGFTSRATGYQKGTQAEGGSASMDLAGGGAIGVYARITRNDMHSHGWPCVGSNSPFRPIFHPRVLKRADHWALSGDSMGGLSSGGRREALSLTAEKNEVNFEKGIAMKDCAGIGCKTASARGELLNLLKKAGITEVNGHAVGEFVFVCNEKSGEIVAKAPGLKEPI